MKAISNGYPRIGYYNFYLWVIVRNRVIFAPLFNKIKNLNI